MKLSVGIVGLPNVGKSTLFNAITNATVDANNYPFCTIEPNIGIVPVHDNRLDCLAEISETEKTIYPTIKFVDIAGLVEGASRGEGLGNKFLSNIRETTVIAHIVRCFEDDQIIHVNGKIDPLSDAEIINIELILSDLEFAKKAVESMAKKAKSGNKDEKLQLQILQRMEDHLATSKPMRSLDLSDEERKLIQSYQFLTAKKVIYVANISEEMVGQQSDAVDKLKAFAESEGDQFMILSAKLEEELAALEAEEKKEYLAELGIDKPGLDFLATKCFDLLGLQTYLTTGKKETRGWTIKKGASAPQAAGEIHTDFEKGFIRANIISYEEFVANNGWKNAKEKGQIRQEGKDYIMQDGDVVEFLFNV